MILVVENDVDTERGSFVDEIVRLLPEAEVYDMVERGAAPSLAGVDAVVLGGSKASVYEDDDHAWMGVERAFVRRLVRDRIPTLGICFGHQIVNDALGGTVVEDATRMRLVRAGLGADPLFDGIEPLVPALHSDVVTDPGRGMRTIATADYSDHFATRHRTAPVWTVQFHPEYTPRLRHLVDAWTDTDRAFEEARSDTGRSFEAVNGHRLFGNFARLAAAHGR